MSKRMNFNRPVFNKIDNYPGRDYSNIGSNRKNLSETIAINERMVKCLVFISDYSGDSKFIKDCKNKRCLSTKQIDTIKKILQKERIEKRVR